MRRYEFKPVAALAIVSFAAAMSAASCAESEAVVVREAPVAEDASSTPTLVAPDDAGEADTSVAPPELLCIGTECPAPFATCPNPSWKSNAPIYKCQNNLSTDNDNCGECGHGCPSIPRLNVISTCVAGKCIGKCLSANSLDCNGIVEDGCEVESNRDPNNCGKCGNKCADGAQCIDGNCGCPLGKTQCGTQCVDIKTDATNCGACNNVCSDPADAGEPPPHTKYGCGNGECGKLQCVQDNQVHWENCDGKIEDNGCEIDLFSLDPKNCGTCGTECADGETCKRFADGSIACGCPAGKTLCSTFSGPTCVDVTSDVENCGACGHLCPFSGSSIKPHQYGTCTDGVCGFACEPGWGNCNGNTADGCEINLMTHGGNCGACGSSCDTAGGQPCINGACLMISCGPGETK